MGEGKRERKKSTRGGNQSEETNRRAGEIKLPGRRGQRWAKRQWSAASWQARLELSEGVCLMIPGSQYPPRPAGNELAVMISLGPSYQQPQSRLLEKTGIVNTFR